MAVMGRPKIADADRKIRESVYLKPAVHAWLTKKSGKRDASLSSLLNVILENVMSKESTK